MEPAPYARQQLTEDLLTQRTPEAHAFAVDKFKGMRSDGQFQPLTVGTPTVVFPGFDGGGEWGGAAVDPRVGVLFVNANDVAWSGSLAEAGPTDGDYSATYRAHCSELPPASAATPPPAFPSLVDIGSRLTPAQMKGIRADHGSVTRVPGSACMGLPFVQYLINDVKIRAVTRTPG